VPFIDFHFEIEVEKVPPPPVFFGSR